LLLAAVGLYGLVAFGVSQRRQEIGVRLALGATPLDILRLVLGQAMGFAAAGVGIGALSAMGATRLMRSLLFETSPTDAVTFTGVPLVLIAVMALASAIPARRATRVDPQVTLRGE
jgi:ABC-type antimicrobial peptide transport system permease subunit